MVETFVKKHHLLNQEINEWFFVYKKFREIEPCSVCVLDVNDKFITMEKIDLSNHLHIVEFLNTDSKYINTACSAYFKLISNILLFQNQYPYIYFDLRRNNVLVDKSNGNITLLDPDSFFFYNPATFYSPGKDKDIDSLRYFEIRLKFLTLTNDVLNSYFTNENNWNKHYNLKIKGIHNETTI